MDNFTVKIHYQEFKQWLKQEWGDLSLEDYNESIHGHPCDGDYMGVTIERDDRKVATYSDHYHDKGRDKAAGFVDAVKLILPEAIVHYQYLADYKL